MSWRTIAKILTALALVWVWLQLWQFAMVMVLAMMLAVTIEPVVRTFEERGVPRWLTAFVTVVLLAAAAAGAVYMMWTSVSDQADVILQNLRRFREQVRQAVPAIDRLLPTAGQGGDAVAQHAITLGRSAMRAVAMFVVALVLTVYLLIEWKPTLEWLIAFVAPKHREKVRRTLSEARVTVYQYVIGNLITSVITVVVTFAVLAALKVPAALLLAIIAGLFDLVPVIGFMVSLALSALLAATVSMTTLIGVVGFYILFNAVESYFINPRVYGHQLNLSKLAVLIAVAVGGQLGGVMGALLALPICAIYPTVERIWLKDALSSDTVERHQRLSV